MDRPSASELDPYLYILMRSDLDSLNPGKAVAQGAHAANQFVFFMRRLGAEVAEFTMDEHITLDQDQKRKKRIVQLWKQWESSTRLGFGVTICLDVPSEEDLQAVVDIARRIGVPAGVTHDPSYPILDGRVIHALPLNTCGYVFGDKQELRILLRQFNLLP